jgi:TPR repeat protein
MLAMARGDRGAAFRNLIPLAEQGDGDAAYVVGQMFYDGSGGPLDYPRAMIWFRRAAALGSSIGTTWVAIMYAKGDGVPKDLKAAARWSRLSADKGDPNGQQLLASVLADDQSGIADYVEAYVLYTLAARTVTNAPAGFGPLDRRAELAAKMTPEQIAEAEKRLAKNR